VAVVGLSDAFATALRAAGSDACAALRATGSDACAALRAANRPSLPRSGVAFGPRGGDAVGCTAPDGDDAALDFGGVARDRLERPAGSGALGRMRRWCGVAGDGTDVGESGGVGSGIGVT
jgi:hypothetical protein